MVGIIFRALLFLAIALNITVHTEEKELPVREKVKVSKVFDGDTLLLQDGRTVRLIGIDAPETHHPTLPPQRYGEEASAFVKKLTEGKDCELEFEEQKKKDVHGRTVAYVYAAGMLLNAELLKGGFAYVYTKYDFRLKADFIRCQKQAIKERKGLWNIKDKSGYAK
jgi:micrococcal nuclease